MKTSEPISGGLFYIVGASGAGKDSLIKAAARLAKPQGKLYVAPRYITRPASVLDQHIEISAQQYAAKRDEGDFLFYWSAHGFSYAVSSEVHDYVGRGCRVLVDGSRAYLDQARKVYPALKAIGVDADSACLPGRLRQRGREQDTEIKARLQRNMAYQKSLDEVDYVVENNHRIEQAAQDLLDIIRTA